MNTNKKSPFGLGLIFGAVAGGLAGLFLSPKSGKENREAVMKTASQLKKMWDEGTLDEKVKEIFGEASEATKKFYLEKRDEVIDKISEIKENVKNLDKEKYLKIVDDVTKEAKKEARYADRIIDKLKSHLGEDWKKVTMQS